MHKLIFVNSNFSNVEFSDTSSVPKTLFYFIYKRRQQATALQENKKQPPNLVGTGVLDGPFSLIKGHSLLITLFLLTHKAQKKKLCKKKSAEEKFRSLRRATKALPLETASFLKKA